MDKPSRDNGADEKSKYKFGEFLTLLKDALLVFGILIGGLWAVYKYIYLESHSAKLKYENDLYISRLKIQLETSLVVSVEQSNGIFAVYGSMVLKNNGTKEILIKLDEYSASIFKINLSNNQPLSETLVQARIYDEEGNPQTYVSVDGGRSTSVSFVLGVKDPGAYILNVYLPAADEDLSEIDRKTGDEGWVWSEQKALIIK